MHNESKALPERRFALSFIISLARCERLEEKIDQAFTGQPFFPDLPPTAPANIRRFNSFLDFQYAVLGLKVRLLREFKRANEVDLNHRQQVWPTEPVGVARAHPGHQGGSRTGAVETSSENDRQVRNIEANLQKWVDIYVQENRAHHKHGKKQKSTKQIH